MAKYHISRRGEPALCHAERNCPLGGASEHFPTPEAAYDYLAVTHAVLTSPLTRKDLRASMPVFSEEGVDWERTFTLDADAVEETKNKGEYSELYAAAHLLSSEKPTFAPRSQRFEVAAMRVGGREFAVDKREGSHRVLTRAAGEEQAAAVEDPADKLNAIYSDISQAASPTFSSDAIRNACVELGFTNGRVPKAVSKSKADLIVWDSEGKEHRISVKSFMGHNPALINASKQAQIAYGARIPEGVDEEKLKAMLASPSHSTKAKVAALKRLGIEFDPTKGKPLEEKFRENLKKVDPRATRAYCAAAWEAADSDYKVPPAFEKAYHRTLHAFATRMTHSSMEPEEDAVTDFLSVHPNGSMTIRNFRTPEAAGKYFAERVRFQEPSKARHTTGEFVVKNGRVALILSPFASISPNKRRR